MHQVAIVSNMITAIHQQVSQFMREGMTRGIVQPKVLIERTVPQIEALIAPDPRLSLHPLHVIARRISPSTKWDVRR